MLTISTPIITTFDNAGTVTPSAVGSALLVWWRSNTAGYTPSGGGLTWIQIETNGTNPELNLYYAIATSTTPFTLTIGSGSDVVVTELPTSAAATWTVSSHDHIGLTLAQTKLVYPPLTAPTTSATVAAAYVGGIQETVAASASADASASGDAATYFDTPIHDNGYCYIINLTSGEAEAPAQTGSGNVQTVAAIMKATATGSPPANTALPTISGTGKVGSVLTRAVGSWADDGSPAVTTQWNRAGVAIGGATGSTYTPVDGDDATNITVTVTDTDSHGATAATSAPLAITEPVPTNSVPGTISGSAVQGSTLTAANGTWLHLGGSIATYAYQWTRDGSNIGGATSQTYNSQVGDVGHAVGCTVTPTNSGGAGTGQASSNTITVTASGGSSVIPSTGFFGG